MRWSLVGSEMLAWSLCCEGGVLREGQGTVPQDSLRSSSTLCCRYLLLVLMDAERAWSYAMQLKQEANTEPRKRFHLLSRLRKAVKHAEELERLCESNRVDAKTKLEAQVIVSTSSFPLLWRLES